MESTGARQGETGPCAEAAMFALIEVGVLPRQRLGSGSVFLDDGISKAWLLALQRDSDGL